MKCRHCETPLRMTFADLGSSPPSNAYLSAAMLQAPEKWFPLKVLVCENCWLVQTEDYADAGEFFSADYAYFSSYSKSWVEHARNYVQAMVSRFGLSKDSHVVEIAANDGYLLQHVRMAGIPCLGVEPTASTAAAAREKGIEIVGEFFGVALAEKLVQQGKAADLTAANNVLAHVPDINDFAGGFARLLKPAGVSTFEFPHLLNLVAQNQFDTIYHEHFSYLSLSAVARIFDRNGLAVFDVEELPTHGGSLRVYAQRKDKGAHAVGSRVTAMLERERAAGMLTPAYYSGFQARTDKVKNDFLTFLLKAREEGRRVAGYGAAAKGNTLLNYAGVRSDLLPWVVDRSPSKFGKYLPGCRIPIVEEDRIKAEKPDYLVIMPWNLQQEVMTQCAYIREWGGKFVVAVPALTIM